MLNLCVGPTIDVGCGPGRLTEALGGLGHLVLGIDVTPEAVGHPCTGARTALRRDVFAPLPGEGRWGTALLADGNVGIGGDPVRCCAGWPGSSIPGRPGGRGARGAGDRARCRVGHVAPRRPVHSLVPVVGRRRRRDRAAGRPRRVRPAHRAPVRRAMVRGPGGVVVRPPAPEDFTSRLRSAAVTARVGLWLGICFGICFADRTRQPLRAEPRPPGAVPCVAGVGLPGHPGAARHHRQRGGAAAAGQAVDRLPAAVPPPGARNLRALALDGLERLSILTLVVVGGLPARDRTRSTRRSGTPGTSPSGPPTTRSPGWRSARWSCTSRSSCRSSAGR